LAAISAIRQALVRNLIKHRRYSILRYNSEIRHGLEVSEILLKGKIVTVHYAMKTYGEVDVQLHVFFTSSIVGREW
jgi:hypothetical protein